MSNESLANLLKEERTVRAAGRARRERQRHRGGVRAGQGRPARLLGRAGPAADLGQAEPTETLDWSNPPFAKWFADGKLNVAYNCVDRHVEAGNGDRVAIHFEGEPGDTPRDHLRRAQGRGLQGRERADWSWASQAGRPGRRSTCR